MRPVLSPCELGPDTKFKYLLDTVRLCLTLALSLASKEGNLAAVARGADREVEPDAAARIPFDEEFIKVLLRGIGDIQKDSGVADGLFFA